MNEILGRVYEITIYKMILNEMYGPSFGKKNHIIMVILKMALFRRIFLAHSKILEAFFCFYVYLKAELKPTGLFNSYMRFS